MRFRLSSLFLALVVAAAGATSPAKAGLHYVESGFSRISNLESGAEYQDSSYARAWAK